ncbi:MAG: PEP-CTERM sorting domain-containing protein [Gammaproteobacteria bacterium]|nr:PEP-CTERM sorting domain-containing protein [Gammaproteobacteria bacterium]
MKKSIQLIILTFSFILSMQVSAIPITSEAIITNPASTDNLWSYSHLEPNPVISSSAFYYTSTSQFAGATHQGYVTGSYGPWSSGSDSFSGTGGTRSSHIFETYIMSAINQTVRLGAGGDDGHSIFVDDAFTTDMVTVGSNSYAAGAGYAVTALRILTMEAFVPYKITLAGANYGGPLGYWFSMVGTTEQGADWHGSVSDAYKISMNATGDFNTGNTIPEPTTLALILLGLAGIGYKRKTK